MTSAAQAYAKTAKAALTGRDLEAAILTQCANDLQRAAEHLPANPAALDDALTRNGRAWAILGAAATDPDSALPAETQANMARMTLFMLAQSSKLILRPDPAMIAPMIEINRHLAAGLRGQALPTP